MALALGVELSPIGVSNADEIERALAAFARTPNGGLVVTGSAQAAVHSNLTPSRSRTVTSACGF